MTHRIATITVWYATPSVHPSIHLQIITKFCIQNSTYRMLPELCGQGGIFVLRAFCHRQRYFLLYLALNVRYHLHLQALEQLQYLNITDSCIMDCVYHVPCKNNNNNADDF